MAQAQNEVFGFLKKLNHYFFLIFCMKDNQGQEVIELHFSEKIPSH